MCPFDDLLRVDLIAGPAANMSDDDGVDEKAIEFGLARPSPNNTFHGHVFGNYITIQQQ